MPLRSKRVGLSLVGLAMVWGVVLMLGGLGWSLLPETANGQSPTDGAGGTAAGPTQSKPGVVSIASASPRPTPHPTPQGSAAFTAPRQYVAACGNGSLTSVEVIVTVKNTGTAWLDLQDGTPDYTIYSASGSVVGTGPLRHAYPRYLAPGATGYYADASILYWSHPGDVQKVEARISPKQLMDETWITLTTGGITDAGSGGGITGGVANTSTADVRRAHVGAFYLNAGGDPLAFSSTDQLYDLQAGATLGFQTTPAACPLPGTGIAQVVVLAGDDN